MPTPPSIFPDDKPDLWEPAQRASDSERTSIWRDLLRRNDGNITRAATAAGLSDRQGRRLTVKYGLSDYAKELRVRAGVSASGMGNPHDQPKIVAGRGRKKKR